MNILGNILQPLNQCNYQNNFNNLLNTTQYVFIIFYFYIKKKLFFFFFRNINITFIQREDVVIEATQMNNDHLIAQTMAVLAAKHRYVFQKQK